jgi:hypothetical protein
MTKWSIRLLLLSLTALFALVGCSSTGESSIVQTIPPQNTVESATPIQAVGEESAPDSVAEPVVVNDRKPQFLNSYADW